jgi:DnaK suppressor protein
MALDTSVMAELKQKLAEEKSRLEKELERFATSTGVSGDYETRYENIGEDRDENASEVEQYSDDLALENTLEYQLREVNEALERMEKGNYGVCEKGGEEIPLERLQAYPAARTCVNHG